eukprot:CAMPEP_0113945170 /NCGR_PEP_ID=MMETSP1339-20121228/39700_1 /TAXON_ID=94617 /ORGANISM="Fibrocapsa japonica" /LENGTH=172 /DNA_ID=CAMNT_0000950605 /DNA_START=13 /DNA_END=531 /DNA_ORIENTATION=- /assembly_acc=CAM_ASM_000762
MLKQGLFICSLLASLGVIYSFTNFPSHKPNQRKLSSKVDVTDQQVISFGGIQHVGVLVSDTEKSKQWFIDALGFEDDTHLRPTTLSFGGAFVRAGPHQLHLMELPNPDPTEGRPAHGGRDRHVAMTVKYLEPLKTRLESLDWDYTMSISGRAALFCRDPDGNAFEFIEDPSV